MSDFMQPQVVHDRWIEIDGDSGITAIPFDLAGSTKVNAVRDYYEGEIWTVKAVTGYGARLSAPGYMDCTDWTVFETMEEAREHLRNFYDANV